MGTLAGVVRVLLLLVSLRGIRWAYAGFVVLGLAYFPMHVDFNLRPRACQLAFGSDLALFSLTNTAHIILFALFFVVSSAQARRQASNREVLMLAAVCTLVMGALVEIAEGVTGSGNCRLRDLIPDAAGVILGAAMLVGWARLRKAPTLNAFAGLRYQRQSRAAS